MGINRENMLNFIAGLRSGQLVNRQAFGTLNDGNGGYCALGLCAKQIGFEPKTRLYGGDYNKIYVYLGLNLLKHVECPECEEQKLELVIISHLNDTHKYSFSQIADWLEETFKDELYIPKVEEEQKESILEPPEGPVSDLNLVEV